MELTSKEFQRRLKSGDIQVNAKGGLRAPESLFDDQEMLNTISDESLRTSKETELKLNKSTNKGDSIFIPGNVPSSKNSLEIISLPSKRSSCCKEPGEILPKGKILCSKCKKVSPRMIMRTLGYKKIVRDYRKESASSWMAYRNLFLEHIKGLPLPLFIGFYFVRSSHRIFDYINAAQIVQDIMAKGIKNTNKMQLSYAWIKDDDAKNIKPVFLGYHVDPDNPGLIIKVLPSDFNNLLNTYL